MADFVQFMVKLCDVLESNHRYVRCDPHCEPKLDQHGLWSDLGVGAAGGYEKMNYALIWFLNLADGRDLIDIAERSSQDFDLLVEAARKCESAGLVQKSP